MTIIKKVWDGFLTGDLLILLRKPPVLLNWLNENNLLTLSAYVPVIVIAGIGITSTGRW